MEAPYVYAAVDALATRAAAWAERRARLLQDASPASSGHASPEAIAAAAAAAVKQVSCCEATTYCCACLGHDQVVLRAGLDLI